MPRGPPAGDAAAVRHRWWLAVAIVAWLGLLLLASPADAQELDWNETETTTVVGDLEAPVDVEISPDGEIWWNAFIEANVTRYDPQTGKREVMFNVDPIENHGERGLVGLALDPDYPSNGTFYVYYTVADEGDPQGGTNYLSRVQDGNETRLLQVPAHIRHNGGRIVFDEAGRMFVSTGDNGDAHRAQQPGNRLGKILHLWPNGTPANDTIQGDVYSMGHRNVYGLAYDEDTGRLFATENGASERDEVNLIEAGGNYGWPACEGYHRYDNEEDRPLDERCTNANYTDPIGVFYENRTTGPTGAATFHGDLYWGSLNENEIHRMVQDPDRGEWTDRVVHEATGEIFDVEAHNGSLYYAQRGKIVRLDVPQGGEADEDDRAFGAEPFSEVPAAGLALLVAATAVAARVAR